MTVMTNVASFNGKQEYYTFYARGLEKDLLIRSGRYELF